MTFFSIIIPVYNKSSTVVATIDSVLSQTFSSYEIIIVNDGSTDESLSLIISTYSGNKKIKIFSINNAGVSFARNYGFSKSSGEYLCFLDADDCFDKQDYLDVVHKRLSSCSNAKLLCSNYYRKKDGKIFSAIDVRTIEKYVDENGFITDFFAFASERVGSFPCCIGSFFVERTFLEKNELRFPVAVTHTEDVAYVSMIATKALFGEIVFLNYCGLVYDLNAPNNSKNSRLTAERYIIDFLTLYIDECRFKTEHMLSVRRFLCKNIIHLLVQCLKQGDASNYKKHLSNNKLSLNSCSPFYKRILIFFRVVPFGVLRSMIIVKEKALFFKKHICNR